MNVMNCSLLKFKFSPDFYLNFASIKQLKLAIYLTYGQILFTCVIHECYLIRIERNETYLDNIECELIFPRYLLVLEYCS